MTMLDGIRQKLAQELGVLEEEVKFNLLDTGLFSDLRIPGPGATDLDFLDEEGTEDVIGRGASLEEALENAVSTYRHKKSQQPFAFHRRAPFQMHKSKSN